MSKPIYDKSVKALFGDLVHELGVSNGSTISRKEIQHWFHRKYPLIKDGTIAAHLVLFTTNSPARINHNVDPNGKHDLLYQIDRTDFRAYNPAKDPKPIYKPKNNATTTKEVNGTDVPVNPPPPTKNKDKLMNDILHDLRKVLEAIKPLPKHVSLNDYINELSRAGYIPNRIAGLMHAIRRVRNEFTKDRVTVSDAEFEAVEASWRAIEKWAAQ